MSDRPTSSAFLTCLVLLGTIVSPLAFAGSWSDPTRPPNAGAGGGLPQEKEGASHYRLQAVFVAAGRRIAIVNDQRVSRGDEINGARVLSIERDRVELDRSGRKWILELRGEPIKQPLASPAPAPAPHAAEFEPSEPGAAARAHPAGESR